MMKDLIEFSKPGFSILESTIALAIISIVFGMTCNAVCRSISQTNADEKLMKYNFMKFKAVVFFNQTFEKVHSPFWVEGFDVTFDENILHVPFYEERREISNVEIPNFIQVVSIKKILDESSKYDFEIHYFIKPFLIEERCFVKTANVP